MIIIASAIIFLSGFILGGLLNNQPKHKTKPSTTNPLSAPELTHILEKRITQLEAMSFEFNSVNPGVYTKYTL